MWLTPGEFYAFKENVPEESPNWISHRNSIRMLAFLNEELRQGLLLFPQCEDKSEVSKICVL